MMEGGQDEWTTIDRKTSKKKSSKEETKPVVVEDGWEQVNKKDKRKKDSVVSQGGQDYKGRSNGGGQRGGGRGRGGDRSDSGSNKGTLPRKNSSKPPRGGPGGGQRGGGGRGGTQSPAGRGAGGSRGVTPQPSSSQQPPAPVNKNTWAAKISGNAQESSPEPAPSQPAPAPTPKFSWANLSNSSSTSSTAASSLSGDKGGDTTNLHSDNSSEVDTNILNDKDQLDSNKEVTEPTNDRSNIPTENVENMQVIDATSKVEVVDVLNNDAKEDMENAKTETQESSEKLNENGNQAVISEESVPEPDSNGNFATDDNENITNIKCFAHEESHGDDTKEPKHLTNGDITTDPEDDQESKKDDESQLPYKDDQWSPLNTEGKKQYDRDFLISLQTNPLSLQKPGTLPSNMEVILHAPNLDTIRNVTSAPNLKMFDMHPAIRSSASHNRGTPRRGDSRRKESNRQGAGKVITLQREDVKLNEAENAWKPSTKKDVAADLDEVEVLSKKIRSILNKLCPQKFDKLVAQFNELVIDTEEKLNKSMELVFEKALDEPVFSVAYARMCNVLGNKKVLKDNRPLNFRTVLLQRCQVEFQKDYMEDLDKTKFDEDMAKAETEEEKKNVQLEFQAQEMKLRKRSLGNIRFIGELYKIRMLNGKIMHECIRKLLQQTDEESLECLCRLVTTIGQLLDQETTVQLSKDGPKMPGISNLETYFVKMQEIISEKKTSSRVRFLMQDVIDLRKANWVKRREDAGPKTLDQIHNDAKKEEIKNKLAMTEPPPSRKSEDRRRSQMGRKESRPDHQRQEQLDWNNVPTKAAKIQERPDLSKLPTLNSFNSMSLGPPRLGPGGGMGNWSRGSSSNKKMSMQEVPLKQANRFAGLLDDDGDSGSMPPPSVYHGRASEPAFSNVRNNRGYNGARSRDSSWGKGSRSRDGSRDGGSYSGRSSRDGAGVGRRRDDVITEDASNTLRGDADMDRDKLETKTRTLLEEYLNNVDLGEAFICICELFHDSTIHLLVEFVFNIVVEKKEKDRVNAGKLFGYLLKNESLSRKEFLNGVEAVLEFAEDLLIDIPQFWGYFGVMVASPLVEKVLDMKFIQDSSFILKSKQLDGSYVSAILVQMSKLDLGVTLDLWNKSKLNLSDFNLDKTDPKLEFLNQPMVNGVSDTPEDGFIVKLDRILSKQDVNEVFSLVDEKFGANNLDNQSLRTLISRVSLTCIDTCPNTGSYVLNEQRLRNFGVTVMKKYLDAVTEKEKIAKELEALFSLQSLVASLEHPNKLLHSIFDVLYDCDIISEDAFLEWEDNDNPEEQEGKGVALKSCTQFFHWLKTAEAEDDEDEKQRVTFQVGEAS